MTDDCLQQNVVEVASDRFVYGLSRYVSRMRRPTGIQVFADSILGPVTYFSLRFGHEIISTAILSLSLIQVSQLSVTGESMGT